MNRSVSWLSISFDSAFGAKTAIFQLEPTTSAGASNSSSPLQSTPSKLPGGKLPLGTQPPTTPTSAKAGGATISIQPIIMIHPQAASFVCRKVFDILIYLAKSFPDDFVSAPSATGTANSASVTSMESLSQENTNLSIICTTPTANTPSKVRHSSTSQLHSSTVGHLNDNFFELLLTHDSILGGASSTSNSSSSTSGKKTPGGKTSSLAKQHGKCLC